MSGKPSKKRQRSTSNDAQPSSSETNVLTNSTKRNTRVRTKEERRLDSLARLLEGESTCVAVCYIDNEILVTSNKLKTPATGKFSTSTDALLMQEILQYFINRTSSQSKVHDVKEDYSLLIRVCKQRIKVINNSLQGDPYDQAIRIDEKTLQCAIEFLYQEESQKNYMTKKEESIAACLSIEDNRFMESVKGKSMSKISKDEKDRAESLNKKILQIEKTYEDIWWLVRDYKKSKKYFKDSQVKSCKILAVGAENEHAEMRIIGYLLETGTLLKAMNDQSIYIGISKLCCTHCSVAIYAINHVFQKEISNFGFMSKSGKKEITVTNEQMLLEHIDGQLDKQAEEQCLQQEKQMKNEVEDEQENMEKVKLKESEITSEPGHNFSIFSSAGSHGISFNWTIPSYLDGRRYLVPTECKVKFFEFLPNKKELKTDEIYINTKDNSYMVRFPGRICSGNLPSNLVDKFKAEGEASAKQDLISFIMEKNYVPQQSNIPPSSGGKIENTSMISYLTQEQYHKLQEEFLKMSAFLEKECSEKIRQKREKNDASQKESKTESMLHSRSSSDALSSPSYQMEQFEDDANEEDFLRAGNAAKSGLQTEKVSGSVLKYDKQEELNEQDSPGASPFRKSL